MSKPTRLDLTAAVASLRQQLDVSQSAREDLRATISRLTEERDGLVAAANDLLRAFDDGDVIATVGNSHSLRVSFKSFMERLRHAAAPRHSDADGARG